MKSNKMKILTRQHQWVDVTFDQISGRIKDAEGHVYCEIDILSIENDVRSRYVKCSHCGQYVLNTEKALQAHRDLSKSSDACLTCPRLAEANTKHIKRTYTKQEDGTYAITDRLQANLVCRNSGWGAVCDINSEQARTNCMYVRCETANMLPVTSIFDKYPGMLDDLVTADALDPDVWTYEFKYADMYAFKASSRYNLRAFVRSTGIIEYFAYVTRNNEYRFLYSKKYQKIIWILSDRYHDDHAHISANVKTQLARIVADVYNKEN